MADSNKHTPSLRFPEFLNDGEWGFILLKGAINKVTPPKKLPSSEYKTNGQFPIVDQSASVPVGYSDDQTALLNTQNEDYIVFGDHTCTLKLINYPFIQGADGIKIFRSKLDDLNTQYLYYYLLAHPIISKEYKRHFADLTEKSILFPRNLKEQIRIVNCFSSIDKQIAATKSKLEQLKEHKRGLMQRLFPVRGKTTPEYRFPEFANNEEWQEVTLGDITTVVNKRNKSKRDLPIFSINNVDGFVPQSQQFDGIDSNARGYDTSSYKIVYKHTFAYNPARINIGSIGYSGELNDILISSLYVCFKTIDGVDDDFLMCFFNSYMFNQAVESNVEGGIRNYLFYENFSRIKLRLPALNEQRRIASCIISIDNIIKKTNVKIGFLESHLKGLQQHLFTKIKQTDI